MFFYRTKMIIIRSPALVFFFFLSLLPGGMAYKKGDIVSVMKRTQYMGYRTAWSELLGSDAPRFGIARTVVLQPVPVTSEFANEEAIKISFSFDQDRFLTNWITVTDGRAHFLAAITFTFSVTPDHIVGLRTETAYHDDKLTARPETVHVHYRFEQVATTDAALGLDFLVVAGSVAAWSVGLLVLCRSRQRYTPVGEENKFQ